MREIKFSLLLQNQETGRITERFYTYDEIFNGRAKKQTEDLIDYIVIACRQYTGLKDKNGKEIYEGDIIKSSITIPGSTQAKTGIVKFKAFGFEVESTNKEYEDWGGRFSWFVNNGLEVIGNIYENPELLEANG